ncbi:MAG: class I SAM-dependent methyltransferase [Bdellovibrionales bacterium]|nr:class I SAM-dependent methyltransferase [Bdellovibrionales bacterium]
MKLEQVGPYRISRPSACAVWDPVLPAGEWKKIDAEFQRFSDGNGEWKVLNNDIKKPWAIDIAGITFNLKLTGFGHLGIFAEQETNWLQIRDIISKRKSQSKASFNVLNLFAYTGGSTLFSADGGAEVVHLDASKSSVNWARENAASSKLDDAPIRWIVDDVQEFVQKEIRREKKYQGIILDPPSYGRGSKNQIWKIETDLLPLLKNLKKLMADDFSFMLLSAHSPGYTPISLENQLRQICGEWRQSLVSSPDKCSAEGLSSDKYVSGEMLIFDKTDKALPSGAYCLFQAG